MTLSISATNKAKMRWKSHLTQLLNYIHRIDSMAIILPFCTTDMSDPIVDEGDIPDDYEKLKINFSSLLYDTKYSSVKTNVVIQHTVRLKKLLNYSSTLNRHERSTS